MVYELFSFIGVIFIFSYIYSTISVRVEKTLAIFLSYLIIVTPYAIIITGGKTVFWLVLLIVFGTKKTTRNDNKKPFFWSDLLVVGTLGAFWFSYFGYLTIDYMYEFDGFIRMLDKDLVFYANLSNYIRDTGVESFLSHSLQYNEPPILPYHYQDIYLTSLCSFLFDLPPLKSLIYVVTPFSMTVVSAMIYSLIGSFRTLWRIPLAILLSFICGFTLFKSIPQSGHYSFSLLDMQTAKYVPVFAIFLLSMNAYLKKRGQFIWIISWLAFFNVLLFPVCFGIWVFFFVARYLSVSFSAFIDKTSFVLSGIFLSAIFFFYSWNSSAYFTGASWVEDNDMLNLLRIINIVGGHFIYCWLDYLPYVILVLVYLLTNNGLKHTSIIFILVLPVLLNGLGALSTALLQPYTLEYFQPQSMVVAFSFNAGITLLIIYFLKNKKWVFSGLFFGLALVCFIDVMYFPKRVFRKHPRELVSRQWIETIDSCMAGNELALAYWGTRKNKFDVYTRAPWIPYKYKEYKLVSVSDKLYEKTAKGLDDKSQWYSPFYQFCEGRHHERHEEAVREFMNDNNINHILLDATQCEKWDKSNWRTIGIKDGMVLMSPL